MLVLSSTRRDMKSKRSLNALINRSKIIDVRSRINKIRLEACRRIVQVLSLLGLKMLTTLPILV